ncbi:MAG: DUF1360 domain-containing protein [Smithella sp.]|jgi:hypothetical protein
MMLIIKVIALAVLTEALVELVFTAAPLQGVRIFIINRTPVLRSTEQGHLLECKYCTSVWIATGVVLIAVFFDCTAFRIAAAIFIVHRISNYLHILAATVRDAQINLRLMR